MPMPAPMFRPPLRSLVRVLVLVKLGVFIPSSDGEGSAKEMFGEWL